MAKHTGGMRKSARLSAGRPPTASTNRTARSSQKTREIINEHHRLNKELAKAELDGQDAAAKILRKRIDDLGGIKTYQLASLEGQSKERGGDSSVVLMQWVQPFAQDAKQSGIKYRMLEVGALSTKNACSRSGIFDIERIDLNSQAEGILQQDFMQRPLPIATADQQDRFDIISLSLVLNFVPSPEGRGEMLRRTTQFLTNSAALSGSSEHSVATFPALFVVLPGPCISNSRYMNKAHMITLMASLGYVMIHFKQTAKLVYFLWHWQGEPTTTKRSFAKKQINPGTTRNNFSVVIR